MFGDLVVPIMTEEANLLERKKKKKNPFHIFFKDAGLVFKKDEIGLEILRISFPAALAIAADPIASLVDTAFIGHIGPVELAAVGVSIAIFNQVSRIAIFPLVSITTSFVAEEEAMSRMNAEEQDDDDELEDAFGDKEMKPLISEVDSEDGLYESQPAVSSDFEVRKHGHEKRHVSSASSALFIGGVLGLLQSIFLIFAAKPLLAFMGVNSDSPMLTPACQYLTLRSLGAPAILLSLAMQGVFRGFKDTTTPLYATVVGDVTNIVLDPILMFSFGLGVNGAAIAHIVSQYLISILLLWKLMKRIDILPPNIKDLQFDRYLKNGFLLLARVIAATFCVTLAASMAARHGSISMAAFQICLQMWLASSLLADGLAVAGQAILASAFAEKDYDKARSTLSRVLQLGFVLGLILSVVLGVGLHFGSTLFTKDSSVHHLISIGVPFVALTQPLNTLAFVFDGVNFGASDFVYSASSMVLVAIVSILCLFLLSWTHGFIGIWVALTIYMSLRMFAGVLRVGTGSGPWHFLTS